MEKFKKILTHFKSPRILDIATGGGAFIGMITSLADDFSEIIGIDNSSKAIESAKKSFTDEKIKFIEMGIEEMSFEKNSFDIVCLSNSMHHMSDLDDCISKMMEMLKPDGVLLFNEMYSDNQDKQQMTHTHMHHFWAEIDTINGVVHNETMKRQEIIDVINNHAKTMVVDSWDLDYGEKQELKKEDYDWLKGILDNYLEKVKDHEKYEEFNLKANILKERLDSIGFLLATQLLTVAKAK